MPSPTPVKITPAASPRRCAGTHGRTAGGAITIRTAPARPEPKRQTMNQEKARGAAQAKNEAAARSIIPRSRIGIGIRAASARPASAPAR